MQLRKALAGCSQRLGGIQHGAAADRHDQLRGLLQLTELLILGANILQIRVGTNGIHHQKGRLLRTELRRQLLKQRLGVGHQHVGAPGDQRRQSGKEAFTKVDLHRVAVVPGVIGSVCHQSHSGSMLASKTGERSMKLWLCTTTFSASINTTA